MLGFVGQLPAGWAVDVQNAGYPQAFGKIATTGNYATIMSVATTPMRRLNFSNPGVVVNGSNTGVSGFADNAEVIDILSPTMVDFRARPDLIFIDGFE